MADDTKINEGKISNKTGSLPTQTYKRTKDVPFEAVRQAFSSSKTQSEASKTLSQNFGFSPRGWRYALFKLEVQGVLDPTSLQSPTPKHINAVNRARSKHGVEIAKIKKRAESQKPKEGEAVMVTVHLRIDYPSMGINGFRPIFFTASYSRLLSHYPSQYETDAMFDILYSRIQGTPNYEKLPKDRFDRDEEFTDFVAGVEVEPASQTHHTDGEVIIPTKPRRSR